MPTFTDYETWGLSHVADFKDAFTHSLAVEQDIVKIFADFPHADKPVILAACHACMATTDHASWIDSHPFIKQLIQTYGLQFVQTIMPYIIKYLQPAA